MIRFGRPLIALILPLTMASIAQGAEPTRASDVVVTGTRLQDQYRVEALDSVGPLGRTPLLDAPFSIAVLPEELLRNSQAINFRDASKYLPLAAYQEQQGPDILRPQTRGMQGGNFQNSRIDGMTAFATVAAAMEQFQRIEVINGPSASLYGPANPSGMFNFVSKRPTAEPRYELGAAYTSDSILTGRLDASGTLDAGGVVGYRLNGVFSEGDGYVDGSHQRRVLGDLGVDVRAWKGGVLELNYSDYTLENKGFPGWFTYGNAIVLPSAPDPTRVGYGQEYAGVDMRTKLSSLRLKQELSAGWQLVIGGLHQDATRDINTPVNNLTANSGAYTASFANGFAPRFVITSDSGYLNGAFEALGVSHDLTIGTAGYKSATYTVITAATAASVRLGTASIAAPALFARPAAGPPNVDFNFNSSNVYQQGLNLNDTIRLSEAWSVRVGVSQDWFHVDNFNAAGLELAGYRNDGVSPSGSVIFKPAANMTTYVSYVSSLQAGDLAPGTAVNSGASLEPYRSEQIEIGFKWSLDNLDLSAALFRIERPFANIDPLDRVFRITGEQVNKGLEFSAVGEVYRGLRVFGGLTLLDARLQNTPLASTNDKRFVGAPKVKGNVLFEYTIPAVTGLVASFDYQFSGSRAGNDTNTQSVAGYNLFDVGARYASTIAGRPVTWRLAVNNVLDRQYWSTVAPSNLTGTNTGNLVAHLGAPRTVLGSVAIEF